VERSWFWLLYLINWVTLDFWYINWTVAWGSTFDTIANVNIAVFSASGDCNCSRPSKRFDDVGSI
jgi:hypothetical protein